MSLPDFLDPVRRHYVARLNEFGATPQGVDWNSADSQQLRFEQLMKLPADGETFSLNDYGCGYGALLDYTLARYSVSEYRGYDISEEMIDHASKLHQGLAACAFMTDATALTPADYTVASGIFNVSLGASRTDWERHILETLGQMAGLSHKGFGFNLLTSYSDHERMLSNLYYADPCHLFDYCKTTFSRNVALLHDYGLYEFTMLVRS